VRSSKVRQTVLGLTALVFTGVAVGSVLAPHKMAAGLGYTLDNVDALNEFRAIYVGLWLATAGLLIIALRRINEPLLGDLGAMLVLGQTGGRLLSLLLDGMPSVRIWPVFILEGLGGLALLIVRPSEASRGTHQDG